MGAQSLKVKFFGSFDHSLDVKGRLTLPSKFRSHFGDKCVITSSQSGDPCIVLWTPEDFYSYAEQQNASAWETSNSRREVRSWVRETFEVELDKMGRMAVPQSLRTFASLVREVSVQGALGTVELWDPRVWNNYVAGDSGSVSDRQDDE